MIAEETLQEAVRRIVAASRPTKVILFGSRARDEADAGSDVDLMVVKPRVDNRGDEMIRLRQVVGHIGAGVDVLVYSDAEYARRSQVPGTVLYWAQKEGRILYESPH